MKPHEVEELLAQTDFVRSLARSLVMSDDSAADLSQQALLAAMESRPARVKSLRAWLAGVIRNCARFSFREEKHRRKRELRAARPDRVPPAVETAEQKEMRRIVVEAVLDLDEPYRSTVGLRYFADLSPRDAAGQLGVPVETVKTRLKRGLARLRERLDREFGGDRGAWCLALAPLAGLSLKTSSVAAAGAAAGSAAAAVPHSPLIGAVVMSGKVKAFVAAIVLIGAGAAWFVLSDPGSDDTDGIGAVDETVSSQPESAEQAVSRGAGAGGASFAGLDAAPPREKIPAAEGEAIAVHGRVVDENSKPVEGADIRVGYWEWNYPSALRNIRSNRITWGEKRITTASDGTFSVTVRKNRLPFTFLDVQKEEYGLFYPVAVAEAAQQKEKVFFVDDIIIAKVFYFRGKVVDASGNPVAGCRVGANLLPHENIAHLSVRTDDEGAFLLPLHEMRKVFVTAFLEEYGWCMTDKSLAPGTGENIPDMTLVLERSGAISGTVLDGDGSGAEDLKLYARTWFKVKDYIVHLPAETNEEGRFRFFPVPEGEYTILARIPGCHEVLDGGQRSTDLVLSRKVRAGSEGLSFHIPPMANLVLELTDESGAPIIEGSDSLSLRITQRKDDPDYDPEAPDWSRKWEYRKPPIDLGLGCFKFSRIGGGVYDIWIWHRNYLSRTVENVKIPDAQGEVRVKVEMQTMQLIRGTLLRPDGTPARGVKILCERKEPYPDSGMSTAFFTSYGLRRRPGRMKGEIVATDQDGAFEFRLNIYFHYPKNIYHLYAVLDGREIAVAPPIELSRDHPQEEVELTLPDPDRVTGRIEGSIRDGQGRPLANALVVAWDGRELFHRVRSDEEGRFAFTGLHDGRYIVDGRALSASSLREHRFGDDKDLRTGAETLDRVSPFNAVVEDGKSARLDLRVDDPWNGVVHGTITCGSRQLPRALKVSLVCLKEDGRKKSYDSESERPTAGDLFSWMWNPSRFKDVDPRPDRFRFNDLKAGRYGVGVVMDGRDDRNQYVMNRVLGAGDVVLGPSESRELFIDVSLASIEVEVRDREKDLPIPDAWVALGRENSTWHVHHHQGIYLKTDADGLFVDDLIPEGEYYIDIRHDRYATLKKRGIKILAGELLDGLVFHLEPPCTLRGKVKMPPASGEGSAHVSIRVEPEAWEGKNTHAKVDADGSFSATNLPAGPVKLTFYSRGRKPFTRIVELPQSREDKLVIVLH